MRHPLTARSYELESLARVLAGDGPDLVWLRGEPYVGKSRLLDEIAERAVASGWTVYRIFGFPHLMSVPFGALSHLFDGSKIPSDSLQRLVEARSSILSDAGDRRLLVVDGGDDLDDETISFIHQVVRHGDARLVLAVRTSVPASEALAGLVRSSVPVDVGVLGVAEVASMIEAGVGASPSFRLSHELWKQCEGVPRFVEVLFASAQASIRPGDDGRLDFDGELDLSPLLDLIETRLASLGSGAYRVLECLAVAGPLSETQLQSLCEPVDVAAARRSGVLSIQEDGRLTFVRRPYETTLQQSLRLDRRRELGVQLLEVLDSPVTALDRIRVVLLAADAGLDLDAETVVEAASLAVGIGDGALAERLADLALDLNPACLNATLARAEALALCGRPKEALDELADLDPVDPDNRSRWVAAVSHVQAYLLGMPGPAVEFVASQAASLDTVDRVARESDKGVFAGLGGSFDSALAVGAAVLDDPASAPISRLDAGLALGLAQSMLGRIDTAGDLLKANNALVGRFSDERPAASFQSGWVRLATWHSEGRLGDALRYVEGRLEDADGFEGEWLQWRALLQADLGDLVGAIANQRQALASLEGRDRFSLLQVSVGMLGMHCAQAGDVSPSLHQRIHELAARSVDDSRAAVWVGRGFAWATSASGDPKLAAEMVRRTASEAFDRDHLVWGVLALHDSVRLGGAAIDVRAEITEAVSATAGAWPPRSDARPRRVAVGGRHCRALRRR